MRFMVIVKATKESEAGQPPDPAIMEAMGRFNEELVKAGVMLAAEGLQPSSKGARVCFSGDKTLGSSVYGLRYTPNRRLRALRSAIRRAVRT